MKNRLLILTQVIDKKDKDLGFFHRWAEKFAEHSDPLIIICLKRGEYNLPKHVKVLSLGKEVRRSRLQYVFRLYKYIWQERKNYDAVLVHMNEEYVLLAGWLWKLWGKKLMMWRNHLMGTWRTRLAVSLSDKVFCTSPKSFTAQFDKTKIMPAGIDTDLYQSSENFKKNSILFFGRISPVKNVHVFIEALLALDASGVDFHADIIGSPSNPGDDEYEKVLHTLGMGLSEKGKLSFKSGVPYEETMSLYSKYALYVNLTPDGSMDKTMIEAMASRTPVLLSNSAFRGDIPDKCQLTSLEAGSASDKIKTLLNTSQEERKEITDKLFAHAESVHGLSYLVKLIENSIFSS